MFSFLKPKEHIDDLPKNIMEKIMLDIERRNQMLSCDVTEASSEQLCDWIAMDEFPKFILEYKCLEELKRRLMTASLEEVLALCKFNGERINYSERYIFTTKFVLYKLLNREDRVELFQKFCDAGGFHLLNIQIDVHGFMQFSQNYQE